MVYEDKRGLHRRISQYFNSDQQNDLHNKIFIRMSSKHTIIIVCQDWQKSKWTQALKLQNPWKRSDASFRSFGKKEWCQFQSQHKTWTQKIHNLSIQDSNFEERQYFKPLIEKNDNCALHSTLDSPKFTRQLQHWGVGMLVHK